MYSGVAQESILAHSGRVGKNLNYGLFCVFFFTLIKGFNPSWNENFQFDVYVPELAVVRFVIEDHDSTSDNEFIGQYTIPFRSLNMGMLSGR